VIEGLKASQTIPFVAKPSNDKRAIQRNHPSRSKAPADKLLTATQ
jgi:hypothetical protein